MTNYDEDDSFVADDDSTTTSNEQEIEKTEVKPQVKTQSNVKKLLEQRNQLKKDKEELMKQLEEASLSAKRAAELEAQLAELEESIAGKELQKDTDLYFAQNASLVEFKDDILNLATEKGLSMDDARDLILAKKRPDLLLDEQVRARKLNNQPLISGTQVTHEEKDPMQMTDDEFLAYTNELAKNSSQYKKR